MKPLFPALLLAAAALAQAETICGRQFQTQKYKVLIACIDYEEVARRIPGFPVIPGRSSKVTQVWVRPLGEAKKIIVTVSGARQESAPHWRDDTGFFFDGIDHESIDVAVE